jgi:hypothetical protein
VSTRAATVSARTSLHLPRFALRSVDLTRRLDIFLVCAVASVLGNRVFLIITGYPQLGNGTLHISHAIWGALMMAIAIVFSLSFLAPNNRTFIAVIGGCGFGWFIDELGKFITRDVNYFFKPTIALIYVTFIAMYLVFRALERREFSPDEAVLNGLEALKAAAIGELEEHRRRAARDMLDETGAETALALQVRLLLDDASCLPDPAPGRLSRWNSTLRARYRDVVDHRWFVLVVNGWFILAAITTIVIAVLVSIDGGDFTFNETAITVSSCVSAILVLIGAFRLRHHRLDAYRWYERAVLVNIFVVWIFEFAQQQLAAVLGLSINTALWILLRTMIRAELETEIESYEVAP